MTIQISSTGADWIWPELVPGKLVKRYKRFLADVKLGNGQLVTAHCPNTGSMIGCSEPGSPVFLTYHDDPKRKLNHTWQLIQTPASLVGVNTMIPNRLVERSIRAGVIPEFKSAVNVRREVSIGNRSRIDLQLINADGRACYIEIKNCTLVEDGIARFPDAVTARGVKHLNELERLCAQGNQCVMFYFIQRMDACGFQPADHIDPAYGATLRRVTKNGVQVMAYDVHVDLRGIRLRRPIACKI
jgi:sugar fermentation stimulation protein A